MTEYLRSVDAQSHHGRNTLQFDRETVGGFEVTRIRPQIAQVAVDDVLRFMMSSVANEAYAIQRPVEITASFSEMRVDALTQLPKEQSAHGRRSTYPGLLARRFTRQDLTDEQQPIIHSQQIEPAAFGSGSGFIDLEQGTDLYLLRACYDNAYARYGDRQEVSYRSLTLALARQMAIQDWETRA